MKGDINSMIVIGYQGIGKSTLVKETSGIYIDLESSNFFVDGKRENEWYKPYCKIADDLSRQGYIVFTSSHKEVRDYFKEISKEVIITIVPDFSLKDKWIERLYARYEISKLEKDYKAFKNAEERYAENIKEIIESGFPSIILNNTKYKSTDLDNIIIRCKLFITEVCKKNKDSMNCISMLLPSGVYNISNVTPNIIDYDTKYYRLWHQNIIDKELDRIQDMIDNYVSSKTTISKNDLGRLLYSS